MASIRRRLQCCVWDYSHQGKQKANGKWEINPIMWRSVIAWRLNNQRNEFIRSVISERQIVRLKHMASGQCKTKTANWGYNDYIMNTKGNVCLKGWSIDPWRCFFWWYENYKKAELRDIVILVLHQFIALYLTISWEVSCGSCTGRATRWSFVESPVKILAVVLSKTT